MPYDPKNPEEARLKNIIDDLEYFQDFTNDFGKQVSKTLKDINLVMTEHVGNTKRFAKAMEEASDFAYGMQNIMGTVKERLYSAQSAATELQVNMAGGFSMTAQQFDEMNKEIQRFRDLQVVSANDTALRRDMTAQLGEEVESQLKNELAAKRAIATIDASVLKEKSKWRESGMSLDELRKQLVFKQEEGEQAEYRLKLASEFRDLNGQLLEQQQKISDAQAHMSGLSSPAAIARVQQEIAAMQAEAAEIQNVMAQKKSEFELDNKHGKLTMRTVETRIHNLKSQAATSRLDQAKTGLILAEKEGEKTKELAVENRRLGGYISYMRDEQLKSLGVFGDYANQTKKFLKDIELIPLPFAALDVLLKLGIERFQALDAAAENFRKETGFSNTQMAGLRKNAESVNKELQGYGVSIKDAYDSAKALTDVFGNTSLVTKEAMSNVALMSANLGVAAADSANVLATFQGLGGLSQETAMNVMKVGAGLSEKAGVPFSKVMNDIAQASDSTYHLLGANPTVLMKSAIAARSMGIELSKMVASQEKLLNYESSMTAELSASAILGRSISFQKARQLAYEGKAAEAAQATLDTVKAAGDFNEMSIYQRKELAAAAGMELKDLTKMMAVEKQKEEIRLRGTPEQKKQLEMQEAALKTLSEENDLSKQSLLQQNEAALRQQRMQGIMTKLKNTFESITVALADVLEPMITPIVSVLVPAFKLLAWTVGWIAKGLKWILDPIKWIADGISSITDGTGSWAKTISFLGDQFKDLKTGIGTIIQIAGAGLISMIFFGSGGLGKVMDMIAAPFKFAKSMAKGITSRVTGMFTGGSASAGGGAAASSAASSVGSASASTRGVRGGSGIKEFLTNLAAGLKKMGDGKVLFGAANLIPASAGLVAMIPGFAGAKLLERIKGDALKDGLAGLADGLKKMGTTSVLAGSFNLIPAAVGLIAMIPGMLGVKAIESIKGDAFKDGMVGMADGLKKMGTAAVLMGAINLIPASVGLIAMLPGIVGVKAIEQVKGNAFKDGIIGIADGLKKMGNGAVLLGALNLIPTAVGLIAMIPGFVGSTLIEKIDGKALKAGFTGLADGLASMGNPAALLGSVGLIAAAAGLVLMIPGLVGMAGIALLGTPFSVGLIAMSAGLSALGGNPMAWLGIAAVAALSLSFVGFAFGAKLLADAFITIAKAIPDSIGGFIQLAAISPLLYIAAGGIAALAVAFGAMTIALPGMIAAGGAIILLSVGAVALGKAFETITKSVGAMADGLKSIVDPIKELASSNLLSVSAGLIALAGGLATMALTLPAIVLAAPAIALIGASVAILGNSLALVAKNSDGLRSIVDPIKELAANNLVSIASGLTALSGAFILMTAALPSMVAAGAAMVVVSGGVMILGEAFNLAGKSSTLFAKGIKSSIDPIKQFSTLNLKDASTGMIALSTALTSFGVGSAVAGIGSFIGNFLGGDPIEKMEKLASMSDRLKVSAEAISAIALATSKFSSVDSFAKSVGTLAESLNKLSDSLGKIKTEELAKLNQISNTTQKETEKTTTPAATNNMAGVEAKLDRLIELLAGGAVKAVIAPTTLSSTVANATR